MKPPITSGIPSRPLSRCDADHLRLDLGCSSNFSRRATNLSSLVSVADLAQKRAVLCSTQPDTVLRKFLKPHGLEMFYFVLDEFLLRTK